jgi:hypothetical protein
MIFHRSEIDRWLVSLCGRLVVVDVEAGQGF